jgi:hypothetical protein
VIPVVDTSGSRDQLVSEKATDALAMALENSGNYRVIARADLDRELKTEDLHPPLNTDEQIRVGSALQASRVITATLTTLALNPGNGQVRAALDMRSRDVTIGELLQGAAVEIETKPIPGYSGDTESVINEALREVSEKAVT